MEDYVEEIKRLCKKYKLSIVKEPCHDFPSGWDGCDWYVRDSHGFINSDYTYSKDPMYETVNFSGNGFFLNAESVNKARRQIEDFFDFQKKRKVIQHPSKPDLYNGVSDNTSSKIENNGDTQMKNILTYDEMKEKLEKIDIPDSVIDTVNSGLEKLISTDCRYV